MLLGYGLIAKAKKMGKYLHIYTHMYNKGMKKNYLLESSLVALPKALTQFASAVASDVNLAIVPHYLPA